MYKKLENRQTISLYDVDASSMQKSKNLPYGRHDITEADINMVAEVLRSDWLTCGPSVDLLERDFSQITNAKHAVSCASGTAALHLVSLLLDIQAGDVVIVPAITFLATANAVVYCGGEVVFADVNPETGLMDEACLQDAIARVPKDKNLKAVYAVHYAGQVCPMPQLQKICKENKAYLVEDACHALGTTYTVGGKVHRVGDCSFSDLATFSFHPVKTIAMGEGGMITTNNADMANKLKVLRTHGIVRNSAEYQNDLEDYQTGEQEHRWYYEMQAMGFNYRLSDIHAALGISQLRRLEEFKQRRKALFERYQELLTDKQHIKLLKKIEGNTPCWHLLSVRVDFEEAGIDRAELMSRLLAHGIQTQVHFIPIYKQPFYKKQNPSQPLPGAEQFYKHTLTLPLFTQMSASDVTHVVAVIDSILNR